jgi:hypothetical protein
MNLSSRYEKLAEEAGRRKYYESLSLFSGLPSDFKNGLSSRYAKMDNLHINKNISFDDFYKIITLVNDKLTIEQIREIWNTI